MNKPVILDTARVVLNNMTVDESYRYAELSVKELDDRTDEHSRLFKALLLDAICYEKYGRRSWANRLFGV